MRAPGGMRRSGKLVIAHVTREKVSALIDYTGGLDGNAADSRHPSVRRQIRRAWRGTRARGGTTAWRTDLGRRVTGLQSCGGRPW